MPVPAVNWMAAPAFFPPGARFAVLLFRTDAPELVAVIDADKLGQLRTGAASGVAARHLARAGLVEIADHHVRALRRGGEHAPAADALRAHWLAAFERLHDPTDRSLSMPGWLGPPAAPRHPLLDHWLHLHGFSAPTTAQRRQIERQCTAKAGQTPCIRWHGVEVRVWKARLWALPPQPSIDPAWRCDWHGEPLTLPDGGVLRLVGHPAAVNPDADLRAEARASNWPVHDFRSGRKATMVALPSAAGAGAVAGGIVAGLSLRRRRSRR